MIALRSLLPPQAPRTAFRKLVQDEFLLTWRTPNRQAIGLGIPLLLLVILGSIPKLNQPDPALGGLSFIEVYIPTLIGFVIMVMGILGLPGPLATYREQGILRRLSTTPVPPAWLLGAQLVVNLTIAVVGILVLVGVAMVRFGMAVPKSLPGFILAILLTMVAVFAIGLVNTRRGHDADVVQPLDRHVFHDTVPDAGRGARRRAVFSGIAFGWRVPVAFVVVMAVLAHRVRRPRSSRSRTPRSSPTQLGSRSAGAGLCRNSGVRRCRRGSTVRRAGVASWTSGEHRLHLTS